MAEEVFSPERLKLLFIPQDNKVKLIILPSYYKITI